MRECSNEQLIAFGVDKQVENEEEQMQAVQ